MPFDRAIYTDVRADEAVDGYDGFNFQAISAGIGSGDLAVIRGASLHQVQPGWAVDRDELAHPPTCAYVVREGRRYLSRGISTGTTNNGRPGNQLTEVAVSSDDGDFVPYRPAQLFSAAEWTLAKASGTSVEPWLTPLTVREDFEVDALGAMVLGDPWAISVLPAFLTMVEQAAAPEPTRLILVHDDIDLVMRWIALGTLFLDEESALGLRFRALVADPWRQEADVVGVSPAFGGATSFAGANVLDLAGRTPPVLEPSDSAVQCARWLGELGIEDTLVACSAARRWSAALGAEVAAATARALLFPTPGADGRAEWSAAVGLVSGLTAHESIDELELYAEEVVQAAVSYRPCTAEEFREAAAAARTAHSAGLRELACDLITPALEALAVTPALAGGWAAELGQIDTSIAWQDDDERAAAAQSLATVIAGAGDQVLPDLLSTARALGLALPETELEATTRRVARLWLADPGFGTGRWQRWAGGDRIITLLAASLVSRLRSGDVAAGTDFLQGRWDHLEVLPADAPVRGWLAASRLGRVPPDQRRAAFAAAGPVPPESWTIALAGTTLDRDTATWGAWVTRHGLPSAMAGMVRERILAILGADPTGPLDDLSGDWYLLLPAVLNVPFHGDTPPDPVLWDLATEFEPMGVAVNAALNDLRLRSNRGVGACLPHVSRWAPLLLSPLGRILVEAKDTAAVEALAVRVGPWTPAAVETGLLRWLDGGHGVTSVEFALRALRSRTDAIRTTAWSTLLWLHEAHPQVVSEAKQDAVLRAALDAFASQAGLARNRRGRSPGRGDSSFFDRRKDG